MGGHVLSTVDDVDDDGNGDGNRAFGSLFNSSVSLTISMELTTLLFFVLNVDRFTDSLSSLVNVIDSEAGMRHEFNSDWTFCCFVDSA